MKEKRCPSYNKNTEIEKTEIGSAYGKPLYKETEIVLSELCVFLNKVDDFECDDCPIRKGLISEEQNN